jgi:hypothetical protein
MSFSATAVIHAAPKAISIVTSATVATVHEDRDSIEVDVGCNIRWARLAALLAGRTEFDHPRQRRGCSACCIAP